MKLTVSKDDLLEGLQTIQNVVSTRVPHPILQNVLLETTETGLRLTTADLEVFVRQDVTAQIEKPGATTLPAKRLLAVIRELPVAEVSLETDSKQITNIFCGESFYKIYGVDREQYPAFPTLKDARVFKLPQKSLKDGLAKTSYAISLDETRYVLNGILFSFKEGKLTLVATDGRRLALWDADVDFPKSQEKDYIVPTKAITELQKQLEETEEVVISVSDNMVSFEVGSTVLVTKLVDGTYPNYRQVIPGEPQERIALERERLLRCVHRVSLLGTDQTSSVRFAFTKNNLDISCTIPEVGEARESMAIAYRGKDMTLSFNPEFIMAPLRNLPDDEVYLELIDEMNPGVLKIKSPFLYVLMPMRQPPASA